MPKAATSKSEVFAPPGLELATQLRPDVIARLELLRIVWRPDRDAAWAIRICSELEPYISGGRQGESPG